MCAPSTTVNNDTTCKWLRLPVLLAHAGHVTRHAGKRVLSGQHDMCDAMSHSCAMLTGHHMYMAPPQTGCLHAAQPIREHSRGTLQPPALNTAIFLLQSGDNHTEPHDALVSVGVMESGSNGNFILFDTSECLCANQVRADLCCYNIPAYPWLQASQVVI
jgi:hypothetical protein